MENVAGEQDLALHAIIARTKLLNFPKIQNVV